jgi:alcohol dehydrogenase (cytochrome c)
MPAQPRLFDHETWQILAYLRTLAASNRPEPPRGDAENGKKVYQANCVSCHRVNGAGGRLGPDLSRIGAARSREVLELRIRGGVEGFLPGYEPVTLTPATGTAVVGVKKNEDLFSVQIMDSRERIQGYDKSSLKELQDNPRSAMPAFGSNRISEKELDDLIRYLRRCAVSIPLSSSSEEHVMTRLALPLVLLGTALLSAQQATPPGLVTTQEIAEGLPQDGSRWVTFGGSYTNQRHSPLTQITPANVKGLVSQWTFQSGTLGNFETTPLLRDNILYVTGPQNVAWALDARTGRQIWRYRRELPSDLTACCGLVNRGFAMLGDKLFMVTLDAHLLALDMRTGNIVWDATLEQYKNGYAATIAPIVVKDKVIVGAAGGEFGIRGFIDAYEANTGKRAWRFYTIPAPGRAGQRHLGRRFLEDRRRRRMGHRRVRS